MKKSVLSRKGGGILIFFVLFLSAGYLLKQVSHQMPSFENYKKQYLPSDSFLFSDQGERISTLRLDQNSRRMNWISLTEINTDFIKLLLKQEDHRYYQHHGVDFLALSKATSDFLMNKSDRGASTITMQFVKNNFKIPSKTFKGKLKQIIYSLVLESKWSKSEILEAYVNTVPLKGDMWGIFSASTRILNKSVRHLTRNESLTLLQWIKRPQISWEKIKEKICQSEVCQLEIDNIENRFKSTQNEYTSADSPNYLPHRFLMELNRKQGQSVSEIKSSLNIDLQKKASEVLRQKINQLKNKNVHDGAVLVLNNKTAEIMVYVGTSGPENTAVPYVDMVHAPRQMGSVVKPFLYATAIEKKLIDLDSWIEDSPVDIIFPNGTYTPSNHDHQFHGWVHPSVALASSLNVPAVKVIQMVSIESFWEILKKLNFKLNQPPNYYGPSLALGVLEASLWDLTFAYRQLSLQNSTFFSEETLNKLKWMLSFSPNRSLTFGQDSILNIPQGFAVKTGTSKDMKDNWCIGYNSDYTVGVWVGNADASPMHHVLGVTGAAPVWREVVNALLQQQKKSRPLIDDELQKKYFLTQSMARPPQIFNNNRILSPGKSSIYAIDHSIPKKFQKILLEADGPQKDLRWKYKNYFLSDNKWTPEKGWQTIELFRGHQKVDETVFLVK